ncbi:Uncharacterised protein r2_g2284 [Pycnogonum litorale]
MAELTSEQQFELRKMEIEAAREERVAAREEERERRVMEKRMEHERKLKELEIESRNIRDGRNVTEDIKQELPEMSVDKDISVYLQSVEQLFKMYKWPKSIWATKLAVKLRGKAREAFASMDEGMLHDYDAVKKAIEDKYQLTVEEYRRRFRSMEHVNGSTYEEHQVRTTDSLKRWLVPQGVMTFESLVDLIGSEQLINTLS